MAFLPKDKYIPSGTAQLINSWTDPVYKFDSSSFYNWEQDNLPIYDLEERDDYLHEMAGYPTSSVNGVMLTVSDCGIDNKKVFGTLSGAIEALPNTLRFPVTIEVAASGQLGPLVLTDIQIEGSGAGLEIINRAFVKVNSGPDSVSVSAAVDAWDSGAANSFGTGSGITIFSSLDVSNTMYQSSAMGVSTTVWQSNLDAPGGNPDAASWWSNFSRAFIQNPEWSQCDTNSCNPTVAMTTSFQDSGGNLMSTTVGSNLFTLSRYVDNSDATDVEARNGGGRLFYNDGAQVQRPDITATQYKTRTTGFIYANALENVVVKDCVGSIYIRGFCVDGGSQADFTTGTPTQRTDVGFDIQNSDVVIENCTATRCKNAGIQAVNSNVLLNRGFIAFRNYMLSGTGGALVSKQFDNPTAGLKALNSTITLSASTEPFKSMPIDSPFSFYRNLIGIDLYNSTLKTPQEVRYGTNVEGIKTTESYGSQTLVLQSFFNNFEGIRAKDSVIDLGSKISSFQNKVGMKLDNSVCKVSEVSLDHNLEGLIATESLFNYNKNAQLIDRAGVFYPITNFHANGKHVTLDASEFIPTYVSGTGLATDNIDTMDNIYRRLSFSGSWGTEHGRPAASVTTSNTSWPSVELTNGSYMNAISSKTVMLGADVAAGGATDNRYMQDEAIKGSAFRVVNGSKLELNGLRLDHTMVVGPSDSTKNQKSAALYAGNNSSIKISGPTAIVQTGVNALAEDTSLVELGPQERDGAIDASAWNLENRSNHTKVELHSTRACLVANKNSVINMHDMGDYNNYWNPRWYVAPDYTTASVSAFFDEGHVQFYPNPFITYGTHANDQVQQSARYPGQSPLSLAAVGTRAPTAWPRKDAEGVASVSSLSWGGMCVRAVNDSQVNVKNVAFPTGWRCPSGPYYDLSTDGGCDLLRIWNIADESELHASYLTVGNTSIGVGPCFPADASGFYFGPSAVWASATGTFAGGGGGLSGAPSSTPDTSSLSVLDSFGSGTPINGGMGYYGASAQSAKGETGEFPANVGPFRLYVGTDPRAKFLGYPYSPTIGNYHPNTAYTTVAGYYSMGYSFEPDATLQVGAPSQLFAQGYATSSDCSAMNNQGNVWYNSSAIYQELAFSGLVETLTPDQQGLNVASSFFYTSAMITGDPASRIWLDESAMNTFANAKNGTLSTSGRKPICSYYRSTTNYPGEANVPTGAGPMLGSSNLFDLDTEL